jgi:hypothetical protein
MLLKLTEITVDGWGETRTIQKTPIWVVIDRIVFMRRIDIGDGIVLTQLCMGAPHYARVEEGPEEIERLACAS